ncbi:MAG: GDP-mannose 4,6-dehydratase [Formivibrio sp.]|nr:GDP-mannose 4,6-dehydratase [Formivibrio sp.]
MRKILLTGGAGFIGSHVAERLCGAFPGAEVVILDKMTYAADYSYITDLVTQGQAKLVVGDVCDYELCNRLASGCDLVIHAAAESHVDRSFRSSILFTQTNTLGTHTVLEACRSAGVPRIIHVSTDEVYGEVLAGDCIETQFLNPTNPYSSSKAAAEMVVSGYLHSFKLPIITVRANNIFGIRQYPEKLIPRAIMSLIAGNKIPLHGNGANIRHYLSAHDFADALVLLIEKGIPGEAYNIGSPDEYANKFVVEMICREFGADFEASVEMVQDRPFNDRRYSISWKKISELGWEPRRSLLKELPRIIKWYRDNSNHIMGKLVFD